MRTSFTHTHTHDVGVGSFINLPFIIIIINVHRIGILHVCADVCAFVVLTLLFFLSSSSSSSLSC